MGVGPHRNTKCSGQAKVRQFDHTPYTNEEVLWFEVTMKDTVRVTELDALQHLVRETLQGRGVA